MSDARAALAVPLESGLLKSLFPTVVGAAELPGEAVRVADWPGEAAGLERAVDKRRREFAVGRACARAALAQIGIAAAAIPFGADRAPQWPAGAVGSITHTSGYCAAVAAPARQYAGLGIDVERIGAVGPELWPRLFTGAELAWLEGCPLQARALGATLLFCAKEALYKCQYPATRRWIDFHQAEVEVRGAELGARGEFRVTVRIDTAEASLPPRTQGRYRVDGGLLLAGAWHPSSR